MCACVCLCTIDMHAACRFEARRWEDINGSLWKQWRIKGKQNWVNITKIHDIYERIIIKKSNAIYNKCIAIIHLKFWGCKLGCSLFNRIFLHNLVCSITNATKLNNWNKAKTIKIKSHIEVKAPFGCMLGGNSAWTKLSEGEARLNVPWESSHLLLHCSSDTVLSHITVLKT